MFVSRQLLLQIYALSSVKFPHLKLRLCKNNDKYEVCFIMHHSPVFIPFFFITFIHCHQMKYSPYYIISDTYIIITLSPPTSSSITHAALIHYSFDYFHQMNYFPKQIISDLSSSHYHTLFHYVSHTIIHYIISLHSFIHPLQCFKHYHDHMETGEPHTSSCSIMYTLYNVNS